MRAEPERWERAGRPPVPSLVADGRVTAILHVSQLAEALGLPAPPGGDAEALAADCAAVLDAWLAELEPLSWKRMSAPTPSRGRTLRELTVNVFHPFELLPDAWAGRGFDWRPADDAARERRLATRPLLVGWARGVRDDWHAFVAGAPLALEHRRGGDLPFAALLDAQRTDAAFHFRQFATVLGEWGWKRATEFSLESLEGLVLPSQVF